MSKKTECNRCKLHKLTSFTSGDWRGFDIWDAAGTTKTEIDLCGTCYKEFTRDFLNPPKEDKS